MFDSDLDSPAPFSFPYGAHQVINGWDTGFAGMRVGGRRRLFIPYQLAYGANGRPPKIPPKSMLVFDVEFVGQNDTEPKQPEQPASSQPGGTSGSQTAPAAGSQSAPTGTAAPAGATTQTPPPSTNPKPE